ncbi:unnamed protein product [Ixodes hexagonus]
MLASKTRLARSAVGPLSRGGGGTRSVSTADCAEERRRRRLYDRMLRVDHAGELGADRIYAGQAAVLGTRSEAGALVQHMWEQEKEHLRAFEGLLPRHRARPSVLLPLWSVAGFALGAATALLGERSAMACTVAVETAITDHYTEQMRTLLADDDGAQRHRDLLEVIGKCRDDEQEHHDVGMAHGAAQAPFYGLLTAAIGTGCKAAIWLAQRL